MTFLFRRDRLDAVRIRLSYSTRDYRCFYPDGD
jgi:hypothetical protein